VIGDYPTRPLPQDWVHEIGRALSDDSDAIAREAVICTRSSGVTTLDADLLKLARDEHRPLPLRVDALSLASARMKSMDPALFQLLSSALSPAQPPLVRMAAAEAIGRSHLNPEQLSKLVELVPSAGPMELSKLIAAFDGEADDDQVSRLLAALSKSPVSKSLQRADILQLIEHRAPAVRDAAAPLLKQVSADADQQKAHLAELEPALSGGDLARGGELFFGVKAACSACHTVAGRGGHVGPDLTKIGSIRAPRDLLESIVYPSASFARGYEPYLIRKTDGTVESGIISRETADVIELTTGPKDVKRIARRDTKEIRPAAVSIMPQGFGEQLKRDELADLIAFLSGLK